MSEKRADMDWILQDLPRSVPQTRHVVVLSSDGLIIASHGTEADTGEHLSAIGSGFLSLAKAASEHFPHKDKQLRMIVVELNCGIVYFMAAGANAYLAVTADQGVDAGLMGQGMRDLVGRVGEHLMSPARGGQVA